MNNQISIREMNGKRFAACLPGNILIQSERDILDLLAIVGEQDTNCILFHGDNFAAEFYDLRSGLAGTVLQKLSNYRIKAAIVLNFETIASRRFRELVNECKYNAHLRFFEEAAAATQWLVK